MPQHLEDPVNLSARHSVFITQFAGRIYNDLLPILEQAERDLIARVMQTDWATERTDQLLADVRELQNIAWQRYSDGLNEQLPLFIDYETDFSGRFLTSLIEGDFASALPAPEQVASAVYSEPLTVGQNGQANTLEPFIQDWSDRRVNDVTGIITGGVVTNISRQEMRQRIQAATMADRNAARTIVRTSLNHISSTARDQVYRENRDVVIGYRIVATLDSRTSSICRPLDGLEIRFTERRQPRPPFHPACRTTTAPLLRSEFDIFSQNATRAAQDGPVRTDTTYYSWLRQQPAAVQDSIIGSVRGRLLRNGGITAEQFRLLSTDDLFRPITLEEMMRRDQEFGFGAFVKAGLSPT